jgi:hypothetical protein
MGVPVFLSASKDKAFPGACKLRSITITVPISVTWTLTVFDDTGHVNNQALSLGGVTGATGASRASGAS